MCDICAYTESVSASAVASSSFAPVPWRRPPEPAAPVSRHDRGWNFVMDWHVIMPEPTEPGAPPTEADLALERLVARVRGRLNRRDRG
jgi:hypothetical protein